MEETEEQFDDRLCQVIAQADTTFFDRHHVWRPLAAGAPPSEGALASVTDGAAWFELVPAEAHDREGRFHVVCFRFSEAGPSAIGFVGWLHMNLLRQAKTGAFVVCGKDSRQSDRLVEISHGIMDYWACPVGPAGDRFLAAIGALIERGRAQA